MEFLQSYLIFKLKSRELLNGPFIPSVILTGSQLESLFHERWILCYKICCQTTIGNEAWFLAFLEFILAWKLEKIKAGPVCDPLV